MEASMNSLVTTPAEMAQVLFNASAMSASAYARAAHETACELGDDERVEFWRSVCLDLELLRDGVDYSQRRKVA